MINVLSCEQQMIEDLIAYLFTIYGYTADETPDPDQIKKLNVVTKDFLDAMQKAYPSVFSQTLKRIKKLQEK